MTVINNKQGAVKLSEVAIDTANSAISTSVGQDGMDYIERLRRVCFDSLVNSNIFVLSNGFVSWNLNLLTVSAGTKLICRIVGTPDGSVSPVTSLEFTAAAATNFSLLADELLLVEISRAELQSSATVALTDGVNGVGTVGKRIIKLNIANLPQVKDPNDGTPEGTLYIPICYNSPINAPSRSLYWVLSGIQWTVGITGFMGQAVSENTIPLGSIIAFHRNGAAPSGTTSGTVDQAVINSLAPGFWLCDGSTINNPASTLDGKSTPNMLNIYPRGHNRSNVTGGTDSHTLGASEIAGHTHGTVGLGGSHAHNMTANSIVLTFGGSLLAQASPVPDRPALSMKGGDSGDGPGYTFKTASASESHTHGNSNNTYSTLYNGSSYLVNSGGHENKPQFYGVVFIMRII
jgi:hypothetical protein